MQEEDRHWHYFGGGFIAVGACVLGVGALAVYSEEPRPFLWTTTYAVIAYICFGLAVICGLCAAVGLPFPVMPLARGVARMPAALRSVPSTLAYWNPFAWRGFPWSRSSSIEIIEAKYSSSRESIDVTEVVRGLLSDDGKHLNFTVTNDELGVDPELGANKRLYITYRLRGRKMPLDVSEYGVVDLP